MASVIDTLLASDEPSVRYKVRTRVLGEPRDSPAILSLRKEIRQSPRVRELLADRSTSGRIRPVHHVYKKWIGAHWVMATLADIGYPSGDPDLLPARDQLCECWLHEDVTREYVCASARPPSSDAGVPVINGRARRCGSQQGNALYAATVLGLLDEKCDQLARLLMRWQWPDGGWNCDRKPGAATSSFWESLIPLRALSAYGRATGNAEAMAAADRAAEVFLKRRLFRRASDGSVMNQEFVRLHYPCYWRYDILFGLKVMAESGHINDPRCGDALDLLESKRLPDGGWPAEERFYKAVGNMSSNADRVSWGGVSAKRMNEWVTADALYVLRASGRVVR